MRLKRSYKERVNIDFHLVETCSPYKRRGEHGMIFTVYTLKLVKGPKPPEIKTHGLR